MNREIKFSEYIEIIEQKTPITEVYQKYTHTILDRDILCGIVTGIIDSYGVEKIHPICKKLNINPECLPAIIERTANDNTYLTS